MLTERTKYVAQEFKNLKDYFRSIRKTDIPYNQFMNDPTIFTDPKRFVEFYCSDIMRGIGKISIPEGMFLYEICKEVKPKFTVEIGVFTGASTKILAMYMKFNGGKLVSIDGKISPGVKEQITKLGCDDHVALLECWTPWLPFPIDDWKIDFLFIDGDHSRIGVIADFHYFYRFVNKGGIILFHDIQMLPVRNAIGILKESFNIEEVGKLYRMQAFKKLDERDEVYLQRVRGKEQMKRGI